MQKNMERGTEVALGVLILISCTSSILLSGRASFGQLPSPSYQPRNEAFGIWGLIFPLLFITSLYYLLSWKANGAATIPFSILLSSSLIFSSVWAGLVESRPALASFFLVISYLFSVSTVCILSFLPFSPSKFLFLSGPSLLAGWLTLAAPLSVSLSQIQAEWANSEWMLLPTSLVTLTVSSATSNPLVPIPILFGCALSRKSLASALLATLSLSSSLFSLIYVVAKSH